jgi:flagellar basal-body rod protein FlgC
MSLYSVLDISAAGMDVQQQRLTVASTNLANENSTSKPGSAVYRPLTVVVHSVPFAAANGLPRPVVTGTTELNVAPHLVYDPGHPDADERGFVALPGTDPVTSMLDLISISRSYEANLRAFDVTRQLLQKTLDMGSHR